MEKILNALLVCLFLVFSFTSCSKKADETTDLSKLSFASESVDQGKTNLATAGTDLITETQNMSNSSGLEAIHSFVDLNNGTSTAEKSAVIFKPFYSLTAANKNITTVVKSMNDISADTSLSQIYKTLKGVYTWNFDTQDWDKVESTTVLQFNFPHKTGVTTNDAQLTVTYTGVTPKGAVTAYKGDLPTAFDVTITVASAKIAEYNLAASYNDAGAPVSISSYILVSPFKVGVEWSYSTSNISLKYYFTDADKTIVEFGANTAGSFMPNYLTDGTSVDNIVSSANAYFQVFNIKLAGQIDYSGLNADISAMPETLRDSALFATRAEIINKRTLLVLMYADTKQKIAQAEAYALKTVQQNEVGTSDIWSTELRFVFPDKSKGDLKTYFSAGFDDLKTNFDNFLSDLKTQYGN